MKIAKYKHPQTEIRKVWVGAYGGHFDALIFFKDEPKITDYTSIDNKTVGGMYLCDFRELYPDADISEILNPENNNRPYDIEVRKTIPIEIEAFFDKDGIMISYDFHAQGY